MASMPSSSSPSASSTTPAGLPPEGSSVKAEQRRGALIVAMLETSAVRVTCVQMAPRVGEYEANQAAVIEAVASADADGVGLPERGTSGSVFESLEEARGVARPAGVALAPWISAAAAAGCVVAGGFAELDGDALYNSGAVV